MFGWITDFVCLDVGSEAGTPLFGLSVHSSAVLRKDRTVNDRCRRPERIERLSSELLQQALLVRSERELEWRGRLERQGGHVGGWYRYVSHGASYRW